MARIRLTYVISDMIRGGAESLLWEVARALDPRVFDITVIWLLGETQYEFPPHVVTVQLGLAPGKIYVRWSSYRALWKYLADHPCDVLHTHLHAADVIGLVVGYWLRIPCRYSTIHNTVEWPRDVRSLRARVEDLFLRTATRVLVVSKALAAFVINERHCPPHKISTLYNGLNFAPFVRSRAHRAMTRQRLGIGDGELVVLCSAQFRPEKRHDLILESFMILQGLVPFARLLLIGSSGSRKDWVIDRIASHGLQASVMLAAGSREEVAEYTGAADVFTMHSEFEGQPLALLEAMAAGLPVAVPDRPEIKECVVDGRDGTLFRFGDVNGQATAIRDLWMASQTATPFWAGSAARVVRDFSIGAHVASLSRTYRGDLQRRMGAMVKTTDMSSFGDIVGNSARE